MEFSKAVTRTQRVFRHRYLSPMGDTTGTRRARVPTGEFWYHDQDLRYPWYPLVQVQSHTSVATILVTLTYCVVCQYSMILFNYYNYLLKIQEAVGCGGVLRQGDGGDDMQEDKSEWGDTTLSFSRCVIYDDGGLS